jgi:hypothetical protein
MFNSDLYTIFDELICVAAYKKTRIERIIKRDNCSKDQALARMDNMRFSNVRRPITYLGGSGPGQLLARDLLYTSNLNSAQPVVSDALTRLLLDFDTTQEEVAYLATVRDVTGYFDFDVNVIDTFDLAGTELIQSLIKDLINRIKPAHTRGFVKYTK